MKKETHQISDMIPVEGDFSLEGQFSLNHLGTSAIGDLLSSEFELESDFGHSTCRMLGKQTYFSVWESYRFKRGMICSTRLHQPFIGLHFQLDGLVRDIITSNDIKMDIRPGEANLAIVPPLNESFELGEELSGNTFSISLSVGYLNDLNERYPHLLDPILTKVKKGDFCMFREKNLSITPRMRSVIQRIKNHNDNHIAGSLFLEAQILDLFAQLLSQLEQPGLSNGHSLSQSDLERIHLAKDILLDRLESPPTLAELARLTGTNEFKLKQGFREVFGSSPYAYHLRHKLELARSYILDTDLTIAEIAYKVGYSDPAHLTNAFRKQYGIRPSDLR